MLTKTLTQINSDIYKYNKVSYGKDFRMITKAKLEKAGTFLEELKIVAPDGEVLETWVNRFHNACAYDERKT